MALVSIIESIHNVFADVFSSLDLDPTEVVQKMHIILIGDVITPTKFVYPHG